MKVVFQGLLEKTSSGCRACGRSKSRARFVSSKTYILPSGEVKTFRVGEEYELNDFDARFLLSYNSPDANGLSRQVFEEVQ